MEYSRGQLVICLSGREKGRLMCVTDADEKFVYLADGKERSFGKPKRKNPKHVKATGKSISHLLPVSDRELKKILLNEV